jgi:hypothetical protein
MGTALQGRLPLPTGAVILTGQAPQQFTDLQTLLLEAVTLPSVDPAFLEDTKSSRLYKDWLTDLPLPCIQLKLPLLPWDLVWKRLAAPLLPPLEVDLHFRALHNILLTMERRHRFGDAPSSACPHCSAPVEDSLHLFTTCPRTTFFTEPSWCQVWLSQTAPSFSWPGLRDQQDWRPPFSSQWPPSQPGPGRPDRHTRTPLLPPDLKTRVDLAAAGGRIPPFSELQSQIRIQM